MTTTWEQLRFYLSHSWNDLRSNPRLTAFALLSIGAGVAAIVSLQLLAGMIGDLFTGSLQENLRGDIVIQLDESFSSGFGPGSRPPAEEREADAELSPFDAALEAGYIEEVENIFEFSEYFISEAGVDYFTDWAQREYPDEIEISYGYQLSTDINVFVGNGPGVAMNVVGRGAFASNLIPILVDRSNFPLYGEVKTRAGDDVIDLLQEPHDIVVDEIVARSLELQIGEAVRLSGSDADFIVRGIVATEAEVRDPLQDIFVAIFGFYYLDNSALSLFENVQPNVQQIHMRLTDATRLEEVNEALLREFLFLESTTTSDLAVTNTDIADTLGDLVTVMGMISLLIGSIGVINTMQVVVRRRMLEIAVLKTLGLGAQQVNLLLITESFLMGVIGSLFGLVLGIALTRILQSAAEGIVAQELVFHIRLGPLFNGFIIGTLVSTVFGLLPTLTAALIRPAVILRPSELSMPRVGVLRMLLALVFVVIVFTIIANTFLNDWLLALAVTSGTFLAAGLIYLLLHIFIWLFGRLFPSFGFTDLKIALRQILSGRSRAATTLLALVVGIFSLSTITLFAQSIENIFNSLISNQAGNLTISLQEEEQLPLLEAILAEAEGVESYQTSLRYELELISLTESDGSVLDNEALEARMLVHYEENPVTAFGTGGSGVDDEDRADFQLSLLDELSELPMERFADLVISDGRMLTEEDANPASPGLLLLDDEESVRAAGIDIGDQLTYLFEDGEEVIVTVVGLIQTESVRTQNLTDTTGVLLTGSLPQTASSVITEVQVDDEHIGALRAQVSEIPGAFSLDSAIFTRLLDSLLNTFVVLPQLVTVLGLVVGGVVIANSVALTTMERRREIAVMKSVGLQRERVLFMLLLENGLLGLLGGLVGVGIGVVALIVLVNLAGIPSSAVPYTTALGLIGVCILVSLLAAVATAWGASGERPLNVLRYE